MMPDLEPPRYTVPVLLVARAYLARGERLGDVARWLGVTPAALDQLLFAGMGDYADLHRSERLYLGPTHRRAARRRAAELEAGQ